METIAIHGNGQTKEIWNNYSKVEGLKTFDLPGHGDGPLANEYSLDSHAEYIASKITSPVKLVGHSVGGHIAIRVAKLRPDMVKKVIVIGMAPVAKIEDMQAYTIPDQRIMALYEYQPSRESVMAFAECMQIKVSERKLVEEMFQKQDPDHRIKFTESLMAKLDNEFDIINSLKCPVEIILGDSDAVINKDYVLSSGLPVTIVENAGHNIMLDQPDVISRYLQ